MAESGRRLLILSCSSCKVPDPGVLPALDRYNGPAFRVVRRFLNTEDYTAPLDIRILSAEFGLIPGHYSVSWYDRRMTMDRAIELRPSVLNKLEHCLSENRQALKIVEVFINLSSDYLTAITGLEAIIGNNITVHYAKGSQGQRLSSLYAWLYKEKSVEQAHSVQQVSPAVYLRGLPIRYTRDQVRDIANTAYAADSRHSQTFHSWYVCVDGKRLAAKWLVRQLTGLPCSQFTTGEACQVLRNLGIRVNRMTFGEEREAECS